MTTRTVPVPVCARAFAFALLLGVAVGAAERRSTLIKAATGLVRPNAGPAQRRLALIRAAADGEKAVAVLRRGLRDSNPVVRRTAARLLQQAGAAGQPGLVEAFRDQDSVVRQTALKGLIRLPGGDDGPVFRQALDDPNLGVRLHAVGELAAAAASGAAEATRLLQIAAKDSHDTVRLTATRALWPFHRHVVPLRERSDWDHEVTVVEAVSLPKEQWRFRLDPGREGHQAGWFKPEYDDAQWDTIAIEQAWQKAGHDYIGVAWYRRTVDLPDKPAGTVNAVELAFDGVDECAWVWLNGTYVGDHDVGPSGWNQPFTLDVTDAVRWNAANQVTVRAMNTAHAGGIWRPVRVEVLR